jgi:hypothetical protein
VADGERLVSVLLKHLWVLVKIWIFMLLSYLTIVLAFNWWFFGWIDLRSATLMQILIIPAGQALAFWFLTRPMRRSRSGSDSGAT